MMFSGLTFTSVLLWLDASHSAFVLLVFCLFVLSLFNHKCQEKRYSRSRTDEPIVNCSWEFVFSEHSVEQDFDGSSVNGFSNWACSPPGCCLIFLIKHEKGKQSNISYVQLMEYLNEVYLWGEEILLETG